MNLLGLAVFVLIWWMAFFVMLPLGVRNHDEAGVETAPGVERGAPTAPQLGKKALYAAGLAALIWGVGFALMETGVISLRAQ